MKRRRVETISSVVILVCVAFFAAYFSEQVAEAQTACNCDNPSACETKSSPSPSPKKTPLDPVKYQIRKALSLNGNKTDDFLVIHPNVFNKELPDLDFGTGTAPDTEYNFNLGRTSTSWHFPERRRFVYNTFKMGEAARDNGEISQDNFDRLKTALENRLKEINNEETRAYEKMKADEKAGGKKDINDLLNELKTETDAANKAQTDQIVKEIEKMDLAEFDEKIGEIENVIRDNLSQGRAQEVLGEKGQNPVSRVLDIISKLRNKISADCNKQSISIQSVMSIERSYQMLGGKNDGAMSNCLTRTVHAKADFGGITYEAEHCISIYEKVSRESLTGDWLFMISGAMNGSGDGNILSNGGGKWEGKASYPGGVIIEMMGTAELVSQPTGCALRITSNMGVGTVSGYVAHVPGVGGNLPITILNRPCKMKQEEVPAK